MKVLEEAVESEKSTLMKRVSELFHGNAKLEETLDRARLKLDQLTVAEKSLEEQLAKVCLLLFPFPLSSAITKHDLFVRLEIRL